MRDQGGRTTKRSYRPKVEALEALRLLDAGLALAGLSPLAPEVGRSTETADLVSSVDVLNSWDAVLGQSEVGELLERDAGSGVVLSNTVRPPDALGLDTKPEPEVVLDGLDQLTRYLGRAWARAGIEPQHFEDCTQEVYETLLANLGRDGFEHLAGNVGTHGVCSILNRGTEDGPGFFRAIDMVKKRTQRLKSFLPLEDTAWSIDAVGTDGASASDWRRELHEAIEQRLSPREAALIRETLLGRTPQEIARDWGVAPKTVSNEKTRAIQKLRDALTDDLGS